MPRTMPRLQNGQSLAETLVVASALVPLMLGTIGLAKQASVRSQAHHAARSMVFECTVQPERCADQAHHGTMIDEMRRRHFMRSDAPVFSTDRPGSAPTAGEREAFWNNRRGQPLLASYGDVGARIEADPFNAGSGVVGAFSSTVAQWFDQLAGPARFGLQVQSGLYVARAQVKVQAHDWFTSHSMQQRAAILSDAWIPSSIAGAEAGSLTQRVQAGQRLPLGAEAVIDAAYLPTRAFIGVLDAVGLEPQGAAFRYHQTDPALIPVHRALP